VSHPLSSAERVFLAAALLVYAVLCVTGLVQSSQTFDEGVELSAGYTYLAFHDYRIDPMHPPLSKLLTAAPLVFEKVRVDPQDPSWRTASLWAFSSRFLYRWNDAEALLDRGRLVVVLMGIALAAAVFLWTRVHYGGQAACLSVFACVLDPQIVAHGQVVTSDLASALFIFLAVASLERLLAAPSLPWLFGAGLALGLALMTKQTGLLLVPIFLVLAISNRFFASRGRSVAVLVPLGVIAFCVAWAAYGFRFSLSPDPAFETTLTWPSGGLVNGVVGWMRARELLPEAYLFGFLDALKRTEGRAAFAFGHHSWSGRWYFFPLAFLVKEPIPFQIALVLALASGWKFRSGWRVEACLFVPILVYGAAAVHSRLNIGLRHLLPIYPFLFVLVGRCAALAGKGPKGSALMGLLALWQVLSIGLVHPHELSYFNEFVGGPGNGYKYLVDSNIDWGQDLKNLSRLLVKEGIGPVKLSYFGTADPSYYGIEGRFLVGTSPRTSSGPFSAHVVPGDTLAVSVTNLQGVYLSRGGRRLMDLVRRIRPFARAGYSIYLYRVDFRWLWDPEDAQDQGQLNEAVADYADAAREDPTWAEARAYLGWGLCLEGRTDEALRAFDEALSVDPRVLEGKPGAEKAFRSLARGDPRTPRR
jgi:hypothetical protein